jgi:hypothetical protein
MANRTNNMIPNYNCPAMNVDDLDGIHAATPVISDPVRPCTE